MFGQIRRIQREFKGKSVEIIYDLTKHTDDGNGFHSCLEFQTKIDVAKLGIDMNVKLMIASFVWSKWYSKTTADSSSDSTNGRNFQNQSIHLWPSASYPMTSMGTFRVFSISPIVYS